MHRKSTHRLEPDEPSRHYEVIIGDSQGFNILGKTMNRRRLSGPAGDDMESVCEPAHCGYVLLCHIIRVLLYSFRFLSGSRQQSAMLGRCSHLKKRKAVIHTCSGSVRWADTEMLYHNTNFRFPGKTWGLAWWAGPHSVLCLCYSIYGSWSCVFSTYEESI